MQKSFKEKLSESIIALNEDNQHQVDLASTSCRILIVTEILK
jgi:hypothetical protein